MVETLIPAGIESEEPSQGLSEETTPDPFENISRVQQIVQEVALPFSQSDDFRAEFASDSGGFVLKDDVQLDKHRSAVGLIIGQIGRKVLSGDFDLARTSFPI